MVPLGNTTALALIDLLSVFCCLPVPHMTAKSTPGHTANVLQDDFRIEVDGAAHEARWYPLSREPRSPDPIGPVLVFLHHGLGCAGTWKDYPARLGEELGLDAFAYSRLGYGGSDPVDVPRAVSFLTDEAIDVLPHILAGAGIEDFILIGHSDGGTVSIAYAGLVGNGPGKPRLRGLITEAGHMDPAFINFDAIREAKRTWHDGKLRDALAKYQGDNVDNAFGVWSETWLQDGVEAWSLEGALPGIDVPWLAILGEDDVYADPAQFDWTRARVTCPLQVERPACGHEPHNEIPEKMIGMMAAFIRPLL